MYEAATRPNSLPCLVLAGLALLLTTAATAAEPASLPVTITAEHAKFSRADNVSTYTGHVVLTRGGLTLTGDRLVITGVGDNAFRAKLTGAPATLERTPQAADQILIKGHADVIIYIGNKSQVVLRGHAVVTRGGDVIRSRVIRHDLETRRTVAQSGSDGGRVRITLHPGQQEDSGQP